MKTANTLKLKNAALKSQFYEILVQQRSFRNLTIFGDFALLVLIEERANFRCNSNFQSGVFVDKGKIKKR